MMPFYSKKKKKKFNTFAAIFCYNNQGYIFHYSPTVSGMYTALYIFQYLNVYYSEQLEAL